MRIRVYPYKQGSRGARALADSLGGKVLKLQNSKYRRRPDDLIINWGAADSPFNGPRVANQPDAIKTASNKLLTFQCLSEAGVRVPPYWTNQNEIPADAFPIFARTVLNGHSGRGIVECDTVNDLVLAPLYVKYVKKQDEYRIHVFRKPGAETSIISVQRKAKRHGQEDVNFRVRNLANGFVFVRNEVAPPADVIGQSTAAIEALGLAFGAVDVIWNERQQQAYVLEVNTAPGLEGQTVVDYTEAFKEIV